MRCHLGKRQVQKVCFSEIFLFGGKHLIGRSFNYIQPYSTKNQFLRTSKMQQSFTYTNGKVTVPSVTISHGISMFSTAGKILTRVIQNRLSSYASNSTLSESQCGFRSGRETTDIIFTARQSLEKCREKHNNLFMVFVDFDKALDTVKRKFCGKSCLGSAVLVNVSIYRIR